MKVSLCRPLCCFKFFPFFLKFFLQPTYLHHFVLLFLQTCWCCAKVDVFSLTLAPNLTLNPKQLSPVNPNCAVGCYRKHIQTLFHGGAYFNKGPELSHVVSSHHAMISNLQWSTAYR